MKGEKITEKELKNRYEKYCRGVYPEYEKEHETWEIIEND